MPRDCTAKSMMQVVPPWAAARVPVSKVSEVMVAAEGKLEVGVGIHPSGHDELARGVDDGIGVDDELPADEGHDLAVHEDIGVVVVHRGDDPAVPDENAHREAPPSTIARFGARAGHWLPERNSKCREVALRSTEAVDDSTMTMAGRALAGHVLDRDHP